jgi:hypothetical protein
MPQPEGRVATGPVIDLDRPWQTGVDQPQHDVVVQQAFSLDAGEDDGQTVGPACLVSKRGNPETGEFPQGMEGD